jgi:hypothetical protein
MFFASYVEDNYVFSKYLTGKPRLDDRGVGCDSRQGKKIFLFIKSGPA